MTEDDLRMTEEEEAEHHNESLREDEAFENVIDLDRVGYLDISQDAVLAFLSDPGDEFVLTVIKNLPEDVNILGVYYHEERRGFRVIVQSESLETVPEGGEAPMICPVRETIKFVRKEDVFTMPDREEFIAKMRHLVWIGYQIGVGQEYNLELNADQMESLLDGVRYQDEHPDNTPEQNHDNWMKAKTAQGWKYGPVKSFELKEHPDLVPFADLPEVEQRKDIMDKEAHVAACRLFDWLMTGGDAQSDEASKFAAQVVLDLIGEGSEKKRRGKMPDDPKDVEELEKVLE